MEKKRLTLNLLNFHHSARVLTCYLTTEYRHGSVKLSNRDVPVLSKLLSLPKGTTELFTTFGKESPDSIAATLYTVPDENNPQHPVWSYSFLRKYYLGKIRDYFSNLELATFFNFVGDLNVWVPEKSPYAGCRGFREYMLRVQFNRITELPELVVSAEEVHSVHNESLVSTLWADVATDEFTRVMYENRIFSYSRLPDEARRNPDQIYPCINKRLLKHLHIQPSATLHANRYVKFLNEINAFKQKYLLSSSFGEVLRLDNPEWVSVLPSRLEEMQELTTSLVFGGDNIQANPYEGIKTYGPKVMIPDGNVVFFFICHEEDKSMALTIHDYLLGNKPGFSGLHRFARIRYYTEKGKSIYFTNKENPLPEIIRELNTGKFDSNAQYVALYLSPVSKYGVDESSKEIYYLVKEELLHRDIISQVVEVEKTWGSKRLVSNNKAVFESQFHYSLPNIAIAMIAKLGGVPWSLKPKELNELVIGVGAFRCPGKNRNYLGSAFSFSGEGRFYGFDYFRSEQTSELAGSIILAVRRYISEQKTLKRLVIHFFKNMSWRELAPIEQGLARLGLDIPVYVVSINKSLSEDVVGFDLNHDHKMPFSGTWLPIGTDQYLFYNSTLIEGMAFQKREGYPLPLKVSVQYHPAENNEANQEGQASVPDLLRQVSLFSRLYWKSVSKQSMPVTLKYPEMLAEIAPHFTRPELPKTGKETLWFL